MSVLLADGKIDGAEGVAFYLPKFQPPLQVSSFAVVTTGWWCPQVAEKEASNLDNQREEDSCLQRNPESDQAKVLFQRKEFLPHTCLVQILSVMQMAN